MTIRLRWILAIPALAINPHWGKLTLLNRQPSGGPGPCHLTVDRLMTLVEGTSQVT